MTTARISIQGKMNRLTPFDLIFLLITKSAQEILSGNGRPSQYFDGQKGKKATEKNERKLLNLYEVVHAPSRHR